jgi:hypothetical protein
MIKIARLKWLGHIARMENNAPCKKITFSQQAAGRKADFKILKVTAWWRTAQDRDLWSKIIKEANAHKGLEEEEEGFFPSGFSTTILYAFLMSSMCAVCPVHLILSVCPSIRI